MDDKIKIYSEIFSTSNKSIFQDFFIVPKKVIDKLLKDNSMSYDDLSDIIVNETQQNVYFDAEKLKELTPITVDNKDVLSDVRKIVLKKLPRCIEVVAKNLPTVIEETDSGVLWDTHSKRIIVDPKLLEICEANSIAQLLATMYWYAFKDLVEYEGKNIVLDIVDIVTKDKKINELDEETKEVIQELNKGAKFNQLKAKIKIAEETGTGLHDLMKTIMTLNDACKVEIEE